MFRRVFGLLIALVTAVVVAMFGLPSTEAASPSVPAVASYPYDNHDQTHSVNSVITERGPPATYDHDTAYDAVDLQSHGASTRPNGPTPTPTTGHAATVELVPGSAATGTTRMRVQVERGEPAASGRASVAAKTPEELASIASRIKNAPDVHVNQLKNQVIAVGSDADGMLVAASNTSSSLTRGQRAIMDELGVLRAPSRTVSGDALHAEENLLGVMPNPMGIGTSALDPCPGRCFPLLSRFGIPWATAP